VLVAAFVAAALTAAVTLLPALRFAYEAPGLHVAIETAAGLVAALAAFLAFGRFSRSSRKGDLALTAALAVFAVANLFLAALPAAFAGGRSMFGTWAPLFARLIGTTFFAYAALTRDARLARPRRAAAAAAAATAVLLGALAVAVIVLGDTLPPAVDQALTPESSARPVFAGHPLVAAAQGLQLVLFALAAAGFLRRSERERDDLLAWFAAAAVVAVSARVNYLLFPSLYSDWVYTGDVLRLASYLVILAGAAREVRRHWQAAALTAVVEERRRIARDLHDGLAQELAYIFLQTRALVKGGHAPAVLAHVASAAERALGESRRAIATLAGEDESLASAVAEVAEEIADRSGLRLELALSDGLEVAPHQREELLRIVREALSNAARHADASTVRVELSNGDGIRLRVEDDGIGFDPAETRRRPNGGFGLVSMLERAELLGAELRLESAPGAGTRVEVALR
jgi:signal transduction histidine kinase